LSIFVNLMQKFLNMNCLSSWVIASTLILTSISCSTEQNSNGQPSGTNESSMGIINWAEKAATASSLPYILEPCSESKRYQSKDWEGVNSCSWALEKEIISALPEYVKRDENGLKFQTDEGGWRNIENPNAMVNLYLPQFHVFILKFHSTENCQEYGIYDPKDNVIQQLKGRFFLHPNQNYFAVLPNNNCSEKAHIGRFLKGKGTFLQEIDEKSLEVQKDSKPNFVYRKLP